MIIFSTLEKTDGEEIFNSSASSVWLDSRKRDWAAIAGHLDMEWLNESPATCLTAGADGEILFWSMINDVLDEVNDVYSW